jgi:predicted dehydrogenase
LPLLAAAADDRKPANERITLGFIGVGTMGRGHLGSLVRSPEVQVLAVCDVVAERRDSALKMVEDQHARDKTKSSCKAYSDFREVLDRKDINAVVIATPDHWHAIPCILAARARKDIYCEKPLTHCIAEGRRIVNEVARAKVIFQVGSQQRSEYANRFRNAVELVRNGRFGKLKTIRIGVGGPAVACDLPTQPVPEGTDWDTWLGPVAERGYNEALCPKGVHKHFPAWRNYREFAGGGLADMGAHHFDIAQWALDMDGSGPVKIEPPTDKKVSTALKFTYANGVEMFHGGPADCVFECSDGTVTVSRGKIGAESTGSLEKLLQALRPLDGKEFHVYPSTDHRKNWLECIRSRKQPICPPEVGHRTATVCHLGQIGYELRRPLKWDPEKEQFVDDAEANKRLDYEYRAKWKI